jgi:plastocyanin
MNTTRITALSALFIGIAACGTSDATPDTAAARPSNSASTVAPTGKVITIEMFTDEHGNYFKPNEIEAHRGDVLRFTLGSGVHNVHFLPDSNPGRTGLPAASEFLQLPGQTYDLTVSLAKGHYYFQCDPHALLGMVGKLEVEDED